MTCDECGGEVKVVTLFRGAAAERRSWLHVGPIVGSHAVVIDNRYDPPEIGA